MPIGPFIHEISCLQYTKYSKFCNLRKTALKFKLHINGRIYEDKCMIFPNNVSSIKIESQKVLESSSSISYSFIFLCFVSFSLSLCSENFTPLLACFTCFHVAFLYSEVVSYPKCLQTEFTRFKS